MDLIGCKLLTPGLDSIGFQKMDPCPTMNDPTRPIIYFLGEGTRQF